MSDDGSFDVGLDFQHVLAAISKQIYETPYAFIRENVQNAIDAVRIQASRDKVSSSDTMYGIEVTVDPQQCRIRDRGNGMSAADLRALFWTIGASGKRTEEAKRAGCVGKFGIGGFANFGVCTSLEVISQTAAAASGTATRLSQSDIENAGASIPRVQTSLSEEAGPRGTIVLGQFRDPANVEDLKRYLKDFVQFVPERVEFNSELISGSNLVDAERLTSLTNVGSESTWDIGGVHVCGQLYEERGGTLVAHVTSLQEGDLVTPIEGQLRFEGGSIDVYKRGFKLCATQVGTQIGVSGRLDCDRLTPTAGRDSLDAESAALLNRIVRGLEQVAIAAVLESESRIAQHTRVFRFVVRMGWIDRLNAVRVRLADGSEQTLGELRKRSERGVKVYYGARQKQTIAEIMQARGHHVVLLSADRFRQQAEKLYLERFCNALPIEGVVECSEIYEDLSRFEQVFLSEMEAVIAGSYEVPRVAIVPGKLSEDVPVFLVEPKAPDPLRVYVDVRHNEITKLQTLGITPLLYSMIGAFCREYLGPSLRKYSPKFFGTGAVNLDFLARKRSELWVLLRSDIEVVNRGVQRQVVRGSDVAVVHVGASPSPDPQPAQPGARTTPRLLQIVDDGGSGLAGYYLRVPDSAHRAYGDLIMECDSRAAVWAGNKAFFVASDAISSAFQYEVRLDRLIVTPVDGGTAIEGAEELVQPLQELHGGLYFPIPTPLEPFLVPKATDEVRLELRCDWLDMATAKAWRPVVS